MNKLPVRAVPDFDADWAEVQAPALANKQGLAPKRLGYVALEGVVNLSYSRLSTFYTCPRKFQLSELEGRKSFSPSVHTAFGHAYGAGVQTFLQYAPQSLENLEGVQLAEERAVVATVAAWDMYSLWQEDPKRIKTLWEAIAAVRRFCKQEAHTLLEEWELAYLPSGKPMIELMFYVDCGAYSYQGHIDAVLRHRETRELCILELKTGSRAAAQADWANSSQTLGYNVILQALGVTSAEQAAYHVKYLCYDANGRELSLMEFSKSAVERVEWIVGLLMDIQQMELYKEHGVWPKRGSSCRNWNRNCEHFLTCDLSMQAVTPELSSYESMKLEDVDFVITLEKLLELNT